MTINLTCTQVSALLTFYLNDKLNDQLKQFVCAHLDVCPTCRAKFEALKDMVSSLREVHEKMETVTAEEKVSAFSPQYRELKMNLSAYIDNELSDEENIKMKKSIISNPKVRGELEKMYKFEKLLQNSFSRAKNDARQDFSRYVLKRIDIQEEVYGNDSFVKVVALFIIIFTIFTLSAMIVFWI